MAKALTDAGVKVTISTTNLGAETKVTANSWMETPYGRAIYHTARFHLLPVKMLHSVWEAMPECDIVHLNSLFYPPSLLSALIARWHQIPIVWSPRGELDEKALVYSTWKKKPFLWFIRRFLAQHSTFHSTSPEETERIYTIFGQNTRVVEIPNYMELPPFLNLDQEELYLLYLGRIHPKKAIENLLSALPLSKQFMQSEYRLKIAGDDRNAYGEQLKHQVFKLGLQEKVKFTGLVEGAEKQRLFAGARFFILPSHTENFGNVVIESLAQGTPVIASKGTPWAILEQNRAGFWTDNAPKVLAQTIDAAITLPPDRALEYRKNALDLVQRRFDIRKNVWVWIKTYRAILQQKQPEN
ncbi:MAG: D-inositol-3-phosphate glycosyltransferase [Saprospiraceae bacterium]|nr:D-inositol-3-phosphate glycosyltransferase [Saprospiraceae bacterium]